MSLDNLERTEYDPPTDDELEAMRRHGVPGGRQERLAHAFITVREERDALASKLGAAHGLIEDLKTMLRQATDFGSTPTETSCGGSRES